MINKYIKNNFKLYAFVLGFITFFMYLSYAEFVGGRYCVLFGDCLEIYIGAIKSYVRNVLNGESIFYSWSNSFGMNSSFFYAADGTILSITTPLYFVFNKCDYSIITCFALAIKAGLSSLFFYIYITKVFNVKNYSAILFSICYALCAYNVIFNARNIIWADSLYLLPLILILIHDFMKEGKWILLTFIYFYTFVVQFYAGYVIGIFSCLYFIFYYLYIDKAGFANFIKKGFKYFLIVVIAAGMSSFLLLPAAIFILTANIPDLSVLENNNIGLLDIINQLFALEYNGSDAYYPYIYAGLISLLMIPFYFFEKKIGIKEKIFNGAFLAILIVSCLVQPLYMFWHAFDAPDGWHYRFVYLISFVICVIAARQFDYIEEVGIKKLFGLVFIYLIIYFSEYFIQIKYRSEVTNNILFGVINIVLLLLYVLLIFALKKLNNNQKNKNAIKVLFVIVISAELIFNACYCVIGKYNNNHVFSDSFILWNKTNNQMLSEIKNDKDFYRVNVINDFIDNGDTYFGYNGVSDFCSAENYSIREALRHLGLYTSTRIVIPEGITDFTKMLLAVKYDVESPIYQSYTLIEDQHSTVSESNSFISCGFLVDKAVKDFKFDSIDSFNNINKLASCLIDEEVNLYNKCDNSYIIYKERGINVVDTDNGRQYVGDDSNEEYKYLDLLYPFDGEEKYIQFNYGDFSFNDSAALLILGYENIYDLVGRLTTSYIKKMELVNGYCQITMEMSEKTCDIINEPNYYIYTYNRDEFDKVYNKLKANKFVVDNYKNGYMKGSINITDDNRILFLSIPWDEGWTIYANGKKVESLKLIDDAFIGLDLEPGEYEIEMIYEAKGQKLGLLISVISTVVYILFIVFCKVREKKQNNI